MGGGFGNGKTSAAINKALIIAKDYPGANILIARSTYPKLNDTIRKAVLDEWCPKDWIKRKPTKDDNTLVLKNETHINFRYVAQRGKSSEDGSTTSNLLSANYDLVVVDQMEDPEISYKDFTDLIGRLRGSARYIGDDPTMPLTGPRWMIITANPAMNWLYSKVIKPVHLFQKTGVKHEDLIVDPLSGEPLIELFEGSTYENKLNLEPDYIRGLEATYKGQQRERYLMGGYAAYEGLVYPLFDERIHVVKHDILVEYLRQRAEFLRRNFRSGLQPRMGYDYGLSSPSCYLQGAVDPEYGVEFIYDGYYQKEFRLADQAQTMLGLQMMYASLYTGREGINFSYPPIYADPQIFKRTSDKGTSIAGLFSSHEVSMYRGANSISAGIAKITELLAVDDYVDNPFTGDKFSPRLIISDKCRWLIDEFGGYYWKKNPYGAYTEEPTDKDDHALDALKYFNTDMPTVQEMRLRASIKNATQRWYEPPDEQTGRDVRHG